MDALEAAASVLIPTSNGPQADSRIVNQPVFSFPKETRKGREAVFISKKHPQDLLGKDSPGPAYTPKRMTHQPKFGFGSSAARPMLANAQYPEASNDLIQVELDTSTLSKYTKPGSVAIGASARQAKINAPDLEAFPMGRASPGPMRYTPNVKMGVHRFAHAPKADQTPPSYTMRRKTKHAGVKDDGETGPRVGPGTYKVDLELYEQPLSNKGATAPRWSVHKMDRNPVKEGVQADSGRLWDGEGDKKLRFSRVFSSPANFSFGTSTRAAAQRAGIVRTALDRVC
jgi:hypothetical protein